MTTFRYQPWGLLNQLNREMSRILETPERCNTSDSCGPNSWSPPVDIAEYATHYVLKVDLPGVDLSAVDIGMEQGVLTLRGERVREPVSENVKYQRNERVNGVFFRRFSLPDSVDIERITAKGYNGVLEINIPKQEKTTPRKITVEVAH